MNNEIVLLLEGLLSLGIAIFFVYLSKYRYCENKRYASKYENNKKMLIFRLIVTEILKWGSIAMLICVVTKVLSVFIALYILTPLFIALHMIFFNTDFYFISFCNVVTSSSIVSSLPSRISLATQVRI